VIVDPVELVRQVQTQVVWSTVVSVLDGTKLYVHVLHDALKFDRIPEINYRRKVVDVSTVYDSVRLPATAKELQQIADMVDCYLLTPKVVDLIWRQAGTRINSVVNAGPPKYQIAATSNVTLIHQRIEKDLAQAHVVDAAAPIACVGKYWVITKKLLKEAYVDGEPGACNYGWYTTSSAAGPAISLGNYCYQRPGYKHNFSHVDPSQTIRLMYRYGRLELPDGTKLDIDLQEVASDPYLHSLISHEGELSSLRQPGVPKQTCLGLYTRPLLVRDLSC